MLSVCNGLRDVKTADQVWNHNYRNYHMTCIVNKVRTDYLAPPSKVKFRQQKKHQVKHQLERSGTFTQKNG